MQSLPDKPGHNGNGHVNSQDSDPKAASRWETDLQVYFADKKVDSRLIKFANNKLLLKNVFPKYRVRLEESYSATGWNFRGCCPFTDHSDATPSFGYNPDQNLFNCFGCHRAGRAVEFISTMDGRRKIDVAREILSKYASDEEIVFEAIGFDYEKLEQMLFEYADYVREFKAHNNSDKAYAYSKSVTWNLDVYIRKHAPSNTIDLDDLEARLTMLKEQLDVYGETL